MLSPGLRIVAVLLALAIGLAACGGDDGGGSNTLNFFIFNEPGGGPQKVAEQCSKDSGGKYEIEFTLPAEPRPTSSASSSSAASAPRTTRSTSSAWTSSGPASSPTPAGSSRCPRTSQAAVTENVFESVLEHREVRGQALQRPDLVEHAAALVPQGQGRRRAARDVGRDDRARRVEQKTKIQVQANRYEGLVVWANAMILSAGGKILERPDGGRARGGADQARARAHGQARRTRRPPPPAIDTSERGLRAPRLRVRRLDLHGQLPLRLRRRRRRTRRRSSRRWAPRCTRASTPTRRASRRSAASTSASRRSRRRRTSRSRRSSCMIKPENQITIAELGGLPPVREDLYDDPRSRRSIPASPSRSASRSQHAGPRPSESPAYQDLSLGIQRGVHPVTEIDPRPAGDLRQPARTTSSRRSSGRACCEHRRTAAGRRRRRRSRKKAGVTERARAERKLAWMLCAPAVIMMLLVTAYPIIYAVVLSLQKVDLRFPDEGGFVGLDNYVTVLTSGLWWTVVCNTRLHHGRLGGDRARARHDPRAGHAPRDLRPRRGPHVGAHPVRDHHRRRGVRVVLRVRPRHRLRQQPAVRPRRQGVVRRARQRVRR